MKKTTKAVIMARGLGTRMRKAAEGGGISDKQASVAAKGIKALIPIKRPFLDYVIHNLAEVGFTDVCLIIGEEHHSIRDYYDHEAGLSRIRVSYAIQKDPKGTADAVAAAESFAGNDSFIVMNSDNYYPCAAFEKLHHGNDAGLVGFDKQVMIDESNVAADRLMGYAIVEHSEKGEMITIHEKPCEAVMAKFGKHALLSMNCWRFTKSIFEACRNIELSKRGEYELTDAVNYDIDELGAQYTVMACKEPVLDLSCQDDIASVAARIGDMEVKL
ncbi:UTP--glucose-1-phosphate uridylyltransferase [Poriferisphaera corsica]|uniref:UTP--glucose-1-phosphate uridylyltransferase n=1 Tax=Poriferisphaera corsica TaxID=2528020 RepID=A0A517YW36_9BACT|nr:nucleotidyltransferase family protein [Poriferisphaera corsica]QDU34443.1 UTP--glucose-1-phosphate uridylyltransferase [Poriferisphaera corsica]